MQENFTILYRCNRCNVVSSELGLFCDNCGQRLITRPRLELRGMEHEDKERSHVKEEKKAKL